MMIESMGRDVGVFIVSTLFYRFNSSQSIITYPSVSFPSSHFITYLLDSRHNISCLKFPFPPAVNQTNQSAQCFIRASLRNSFIVVPCRLVIVAKAIFCRKFDDIMPRVNATPYVYEADLVSDEEGELVSEASKMSAKRSAMPPLLLTRDRVQVMVTTMACQCDLGEEQFRHQKGLHPRRQEEEAAEEAEDAVEETARGAAAEKTGSKDATPAEVGQSSTTSPIRAPPPTNATPMEVEGVEPEVEAQEQNVPPTTPKKKRYRKKRRREESSQRPPSDLRDIIEKKKDEELAKASNRPTSDANTNAPSSTPTTPLSRWQRRRIKRQYKTEEYEARQSALASRTPSRSSTPNRPPPSAIVVNVPTTPKRANTPRRNNNTPVASSRRPRAKSQTPSRQDKRIRFEEPRPLPPILKGQATPKRPDIPPSSTSVIMCKDVRVTDGEFSQSSVRRDTAASPEPSSSSSRRKGGKNKSTRGPNETPRSRPISEQWDELPKTQRAAPGWLEISNRRQDAAPQPASSSSKPPSSADPMQHPEILEGKKIRKMIDEQKKFLSDYFNQQQDWAREIELNVFKRRKIFESKLDIQKKKEMELLERRQKQEREQLLASQHSSNLPKPPSPPPKMPHLEPMDPDSVLSDPSSEWDE